VRTYTVESSQVESGRGNGELGKRREERDVFEKKAAMGVQSLTDDGGDELRRKEEGESLKKRIRKRGAGYRNP